MVGTRNLPVEQVEAPASEQEPTTSTRRRLNDSPTERRVVPAMPLLDCVPVIAIDASELRTRPLDPQTAFLVSRIDGDSTVSTLLDICGMAEEDALMLLDELINLGVVVLR